MEKDEALVQTTGRYQGKLLCPYAYGVVLPNITRRMFDSQPVLAQVMDAHLVICKDEMTQSVDAGLFQERLWAMSHYNFGITLTSEQIDRIRWHLYPEMRISTKQLSFFDDEPEETLQTAIPKVLKVMDLQQEQLARNIGEGHRVIHGVAGSGKGADSGDAVEAAEDAAKSLARTSGAAVAVTGPVDFLTDGARTARVAGGSALMPKVTALGCSLTALTGAYAAVTPPFEAARAALAHFAMAGAEAEKQASGPGSFQLHFLDALANVQPADLE